MNNKIGVGVIIFGIAALVTAIGTAAVNLLTLKWAAKIYEPWDRMTRKLEPLADKAIDYCNKQISESTYGMEDD